MTAENHPDQTSDADREPINDEELRAVTIGDMTPLTEPILIAEYDPEWPQLYQLEERRIRTALGDRALLIEHVGSTSVPGLAAKPRIDILLVVANTADEASYVPDLEAAGYILRIREPEWYEHRMFNGRDIELNLHVFSDGCEEVERMLRFRDHLRRNDADRHYYEQTKRDLASRDWKYTQNYADAKSAVVEEIIARAMSDDGRPVS